MTGNHQSLLAVHLPKQTVSTPKLLDSSSAIAFPIFTGHPPELCRVAGNQTRVREAQLVDDGIELAEYGAHLKPTKWSAVDLFNISYAMP
jgi:hypothetical protein